MLQTQFEAFKRKILRGDPGASVRMVPPQVRQFRSTTGEHIQLLADIECTLSNGIEGVYSVTKNILTGEVYATPIIKG